ncbi:MAG: prepilin-type N-terminal cleavage/methylation domain-containing protein [Patescibacteria group bacterium]
MYTNKKNNNFGFTLLETIVAVAILVTAIIGPFSLASQSINAQGRAKNNLIAANLAQEGLELFRNYRANNILKMLNDANNTGNAPDYSLWLVGADACRAASGCGIDAFTYIQFPPNSSIVDLNGCASLESCTLYLNDNGVYRHNPSGIGGIPTKFHRTITIQEITINTEIKVTATVWWSDSLGTDSFSVSTHLMNW